MDEINRFLSTELLENVFMQLKATNLNQLLRRKYNATNEFVYYDIRYRSYGAHSFILLRNAFDSYCSIQQEMVVLCRCLKVDASVTHYAVELFDKFYTNLIASARKNGLLKSLEYSSDLTENFGVNIWNLTNLKMRYDRLYLQIVNDHSFTHYARTVCMAVCIFIASKQFECQHLLLSKIKSFLYSLDVPVEWCQKRLLALIEIKILNLINFELNLTPLKIYAETILIILSRCLLPTYYSRYFTSQKLSQMRAICLILVENYYMLQVPFLVKLFQVYNGREFNFYMLEDIDDVENFNRDKLLIASCIVAATCTLVNEHFDNLPVLRYISYISEIELVRVERGANAVLQFLFAGPLEGHRKKAPVNVFAYGG